MRDNSQRAKVAINVLWIIFGLEILSVFSSYLQYNLLTKLFNDEYVSDQAIQFNDTREMVTGVVYAIVYIISAITFIRWFRRAYYNLHQKVAVLDFEESWAAASWFVPFMNLIRPYRIMNELYQETNLLLKRHLNSYQRVSTVFVGIWWASWILTNILNNIIVRTSLDATTIDELIDMTTMSGFSTLIGLPVCLLAVKVVKDYAQMEEKLWAIDTDGKVSRCSNTSEYDDILDVPVD